MFRRKTTNINGVEIPEDFPVSSIINNIAISSDGRYAAVTRAGDLVIANIPADGKIEVDGTVINYRSGTGRTSINIGGKVHGAITSGLYTSSVVISGSGGNISIGRGSQLEYEIDQGYDLVSSVSLKEIENDINLRLSPDNKLYVKGSTASHPVYRSGHLVIDRLEGNLLLPTSEVNLEQSLTTMSGHIRGDVAHPGRINTMSGDISLVVRSPIAIEASTMSGDVSVRGMMADGTSRYIPPAGKPIGTLYLETMSGNINVRYEPK